MHFVRLSLLLIAAASLPPAAAVEPPDRPVPAGAATERFQLPAGFQATLFAGEPDVVQPIALTTDDRGRVWVVECHSYPGWTAQHKDRVLIFEDRDGDGRFDARKVFLDDGLNLSGIEVGFGGVWLCSTPNLVFVPDADGDDRPDGPPQVKLDGWDLKAKHNVFNGLCWGPDGWLWGCNGILSNSSVGKPGASVNHRTALNCGVWRYHPVREAFEVVAHGTTNPWGLDFDELGEAFITNCVIKHLFHVVPGGHYERMFGQDVTPHVYQLLPSCADHIHWAGGPWTDARGGALHDAAGGGHAHSGAMIYLGDNWPAEYRNSLLTSNLHGSRLNRDLLTRQGSGYVGQHAADLLRAGDPWFRGIAIRPAADGGVLVTDWCDTGECHNYETVDRTNGRIYKLTYGRPQQMARDISKLSDQQLVALQTDRNEWLVRHARRVLQERRVAGRLEKETAARLAALFRGQHALEARLRALWALHAVGALSEAIVDEALASRDAPLRAWGVRLELDDRQASPAMVARWAKLAAGDPSPVVRLALAAGLQRLPVVQRWEIAAALAAHAEDAGDANLPLMLWYGVAPLVEAEPRRAIELAEAAGLGQVRRLVARRAAEVALESAAEQRRAVLDALIAAAATAHQRGQTLDLLLGVVDTLQVRRQVDMPSSWPELFARLMQSQDSALREAAIWLAVIFGDRQAIAALREEARDPQRSAAERGRMVAALAQAKVPGLPDLLFELLDQPALCVAALRALATYDEPTTPRVVLEKYPGFDGDQKSEALGLLASRRGYALALVSAIDRNVVRLSDLNVLHVQQLENLGDPTIGRHLPRLRAVVPRSTPERRKLLADYRARLTPAVLAQANVSAGRQVYVKTCAACHTLFDAGGKIGPDLTGSQRKNLDFVLTNVLDPSAVVGKDFLVTIFQTADGRVVGGIIVRENSQGVVVQTATEQVQLPREEIEARRATNVSIMPEGLLAKLTDEEVRDLVAYLAAPAQVPLGK